jgi:glycerol dehydrogenase-like iron-containing ADH family enzyme
MTEADVASSLTSCTTPSTAVPFASLKKIFKAKSPGAVVVDVDVVVGRPK